MNVQENLLYTKEHEWLKQDGEFAYVGITDFAQHELGDIVFIDINTVGETIEKDKVFGTIEAVKTVADLFLPVSGEIIEFNEKLNSEPETVNKDAYNEGWLIKMRISNPDELKELMDATAYKALINV